MRPACRQNSNLVNAYRPGPSFLCKGPKPDYKPLKFPHKICDKDREILSIGIIPPAIRVL